MLCVTSICAQEYLAELPENPEPNKCYAKCIVPDEYKDETVRVLLRPAYDKLEVVPAEYKNEYQDVVIRPASKRFIYSLRSMRPLQIRCGSKILIINLK
ncbi:MAG: hypothetical protein ABF261_07390 [Candidatus Arcticimaribacter sp.]